tara:strand:+ start:186 stop:767 length:582 start_codon:yes stop_codon:yes gene_type:complete
MNNFTKFSGIIQSEIKEHYSLINKIKVLDRKIAICADKMFKSLSKGKSIIWCGNGGSAADSQHLSAELVGRFMKNRKALKSIALTTDSSALTAISNDYSFEKVFERQIEALGTKGDILVVISTSGNSKNLVRVAKFAKKKKIFVIGLLGKKGGKLKKICNENILVDSNSTPRIQEVHILVGHILCLLIEKKLK